MPFVYGFKEYTPEIRLSAVTKMTNDISTDGKGFAA